MAKEYCCKHVAYHKYFCCDTCWNTHPEATPGEMFLNSKRYNEIQRENFLKKAEKFNFSKKQAEFLYEYLVI